MAVAATRVTPDLEELDANGVLEHMVERFHPRLTVACSFQKEASVILDLLLRIAPDARVFTLDTHVLFPETYETWRRVEERYGIEVEVFQGPSIGRQAAVHGDRLWERDPDACCAIRKVDPLNQALAGMDAWISGLRRDQSPSRATTPKLAWDAQARALEGEPAGRLDRGATSGATSSSTTCPTTRCTTGATPRSAARTAPLPGEGRDGRWTGSAKTECGLHG